MARQLPLVHQGRLRRAGRRFGAALALFALCLRLIWPAPPVPTAPDRALLAALGEHALCLAASTTADAPLAPRDRAPSEPAGHADHDGLGCCLWHAATGATLPQTAAVAPVAFVGTRSPPAIAAALSPVRHAGPAQARAPPARS